MHLSLDEANLLADPRYQSGYWHVYPKSQRYHVTFNHGSRRVVQRKFRTPISGAAWIADYFRSHYGEDWIGWVFPERYGLTRGPGWQIRAIADGEYLLEVCPCGIWCRVEYRKNGRRTDIFPDTRTAQKALRLLAKRVWPLFGNRILDPSPYRTPRACVFLPAKVR